MQPAQLATALQEVAARLGIEVRAEVMDRNHPLGGAGGGFCRLRGKPMILLDSRLTPSDRVAILARALSRFDLEAVFLAPAVRESIDAHGASPERPRPRPRPLAQTRGKRG